MAEVFKWIRLFSLVVLLMLLAGILWAQATRIPAGSANPLAIEVTDVRGSKHVVVGFDSGWQSGRTFFLDLPFTDVNGPLLSSEAMETLVAVELHTPEDQAKMDKVANARRLGSGATHTVLLIPSPSIQVITFTHQKVGDRIQTRSVISLAGGQPFDGGGGFGYPQGKESLGSLGIADFSAEFSDIKAIRSLAPVPFVGDFARFGTAEVPFTAKVTDTAGEVIALKGLYCDTGEYVAGENRRGGVRVAIQVRFTPNLSVYVGGVSKLSIPASKLRTMSLVKVSNEGFDAKAILRTGENVDLTIVSNTNLHASGILGASAKGWLWIPWYSVASVEFEEQ
jgi:hypothetical protein